MSRPRFTGGTLGGRPLPHPVPEGARPTASRVREAVFSMVGQDLDGVRFLDAFGGAGLMGLEAWSRGASVTFGERDRRRVRRIREQIVAVGAEQRTQIVAGDILRKVQDLPVFDIVFADPPYALEAAPVIAALSPAVGRWLVYESEDRGAPPASEPLELYRVRTYGRSVLWVYRRIE